LFAGYGRLTNYLAAQKVDLEAVELEPEFAKFINLEKSKIHVKDVLTLSSSHYERIIAGYNSFVLFTQETDIKQFFSVLDSLLAPGGYASLNYFDTNNWSEPTVTEFLANENKISYMTNFKLSTDNKELGDLATF
jgi:hypothetical protein